jgi:hypothetical protein
MAVDNSDQIAALRDAIAQGARKIVFHTGGTRREVEYHSLKDMREALQWLEQQQNPTPAMTFVAFRTRR